jgi:hypothetical protein
MKAETGSGMYQSESAKQTQVTILHFNIGKRGKLLLTDERYLHVRVPYRTLHRKLGGRGGGVSAMNQG